MPYFGDTSIDLLSRFWKPSRTATASMIHRSGLGGAPPVLTSLLNIAMSEKVAAMMCWMMKWLLIHPHIIWATSHGESSWPLRPRISMK